MASFTKNLQNFFSIGIAKNRRDQKEIIPKEVVSKEGKTLSKKVKFSDSIQRLWKWYIEQTSDSSESLKNRMDRYDDLDYMLYNDTITSMAADLYADEASQADVQTEPIFVEAKKTAVKNSIKALFQQWGIDQTYIRETAWNIAFYGDSFDINIFSKENGIEDITPVDVRTVLERLEFNAAEVSKRMKGKTKSYITRDPRLKDLINEIESNSSDYAHNFKSYLLGFQIEGGFFLPPWGVNHYRNFSRRSEFWPFGRSTFIYSIGPFRQLKTSKNLMALARAMKFPKEVFEVNVSENMTEIEQWEAVNEARTEYENLGVNNQAKDDFSVGSQIWIPNNLINHRTIENNLRIEDIADIELLRDDHIMGTRIPKGFLIVDRSSFGTSGQSLLQQYKPFGRAVYSIQSVILEQLTKLIKMHFLMTEQFDKEFTEFELSMNFPVIEEAQDRLRMKQDTLRLANDVISNIQNALGTRDGLPPDVIELIFSKLSFLEPEEVKDIMARTVKGLGLDKDNNDDESSSNRFFDKKLSEELKSKLTEEIIFDSYFEAKNKLGLQEGVFNQRHFFNSSKMPSEHQHIFSLLRKDSFEEISIKG